MSLVSYVVEDSVVRPVIEENSLLAAAPFANLPVSLFWRSKVLRLGSLGGCVRSASLTVVGHGELTVRIGEGWIVGDGLLVASNGFRDLAFQQ